MAATPEQARINGKKGGRPKGTFTRPQIRDFFTEEDIRNLIEDAKKKAQEGDATILRTLIEQIFGKPAQALELQGKDGESIKIEISEAIAKKNGL